MASEQFNLSENYRHWLAETSDGHETTEDELSDNLRGNDAYVQHFIQDFSLEVKPPEPYVGMEFLLAEDAREFYEMYGRSVGFTIRNNRIRRSVKDNSIIGREFVCSKEGFRGGKYKKKESIGCTSKPPTREGCSAMLRIAAKDGGKWIIYCFIEQHNHELNPSTIPPRRSHRIAFNEDEKDLKIRELFTELHREKKKSAAYQEQLEEILKCVEVHMQKLSVKAEEVANKVKELESSESSDSDLSKTQNILTNISLVESQFGS